MTVTFATSDADVQAARASFHRRPCALDNLQGFSIQPFTSARVRPGPCKSFMGRCKAVTLIRTILALPFSHLVLRYKAADRNTSASLSFVGWVSSLHVEWCGVVH